MTDHLYAVQKAIDESTNNHPHKLNLENLTLNAIPIEIIKLSGLKKLNLFGNNITEIPNEIINSLPHLTWLDIRKNNLREIPRSIANLHNLTNLLVGDNKLTRLPIELGCLQKLTGLNFENNCISFPSNDIIRKGPNFILKYLKMCSKRKEMLMTESGLGLELKSDQLNIDREISFPKFKFDSDQLGNLDRNNSYVIQEEVKLPIKHVLVAFDDLAIKQVDVELKGDEEPDDEEASANQFELFKPKVYRKIANDYLKNRRRTFRSNTWNTYRTQSERHAFLLGEQSEPKTMEQVRKVQLEQRKFVKQQKERIRQESIIQRIKDKDFRDDWKTEYRTRQQNIGKIYRSKSAGAIKSEARERVKVAPFDISSDELSVMSPEELVKLKTQARTAIVRDPLPPPRSKQILFRMEQERRRKDLMLVAKIREHAEMLQRAATENNLANATFDLNMALQLQKRLLKRRDVLTQLKMTTHPTAFL